MIQLCEPVRPGQLTRLYGMPGQTLPEVWHSIVVRNRICFEYWSGTRYPKCSK